MSGGEGAPAREPCPICRRPSDPIFHPFCSQRCADVDLGRWFNERYAIPEEDADHPPSEPSEPE